MPSIDDITSNTIGNLISAQFRETAERTAALRQIVQRQSEEIAELRAAVEEWRASVGPRSDDDLLD